MTENPVPRSRRRRWPLLAIPTLLLLAAIDAFLIEPNWVALTRHETGSGENEISILHLTDLHITTPGSRERRVLEIVDETKPDVIVITGDSVLHGTDFDAFTGFLSKLKAPLGVFACPGNWEDWVDGSYDCYPRAGVKLLDDGVFRIGSPPVELVGLSSARSAIPPPPDGPRIVLCHYPAVFPSAARAKADLVLAGHTHGGQVRLPFVGALHLPFDSGGYEAGWYGEDGSRMYVSRGVGTSVLPARFLCRPEGALIRFRY